MIRGTTPTLEFELPFPADRLSEVWMTIAQNKKVIIDKPRQELELNGNTIIARLTQEETLKLSDSTVSEIQLRVKPIEGGSLATDIIKVSTGRILKDGVI